MVKIAILSECNPDYDRLKIRKNTFEYSKVREDIKNNVVFHDVNNIGQLFALITKILSPDQGEMFNVYDFFYNEDYALQGIYLGCENEKDPKFNMLGSQLVLGNFMKKSLIIIKRDFHDNKLSYNDVKLDDIVDSVISSFLHKCIIIKSDGTINELSYLFDPLENYDAKYNTENIRYHEHKFMDFIATFYVNINDPKTKLNEKATRVIGKKIYGDVMVSLRDSCSVSSNKDLTEEIFSMIYKLCNVGFDNMDLSMYKRGLDIGNKELSPESELHCFPTVAVYPNFYYFLRTEYERVKNKTDNHFNESLYVEVLNDIK